MEESNDVILFIPSAGELYPVRDEEDGLQVQSNLFTQHAVYSWLIYRNTTVN